MTTALIAAAAYGLGLISGLAVDKWVNRDRQIHLTPQEIASYRARLYNEGRAADDGK